MKRIKCRLTTLTPCHVGSGRTLNRGMDFVTEGSKNGRLGIIEPRKIYDIVGDNGIGMWCNAIERHANIYKEISKSHKNIGLSDVCSRTMDFYGDKEITELQEQLFSGGQPCLPGSSIKGSIVTAILTSMGNEKLNDAVNARNVIDKCFSLNNNPQTSVLRFLRVGDACFDVPTIAFGCNILNIRDNCNILNIRDDSDKLIDTKGASLSECIYTDETAQFTIDLMDTGSEYFKDVRGSVATLPEAMQSIEKLMLFITNHTKRLLKQEIKFWEDREYPERKAHIACINEQIKACNSALATNGKSAVLRLGYGSGYSFITGDWYRERVGANSKLWKDTLRYKIRRDKDDEHGAYPYIKTRRVFYEDPGDDPYMLLLGFAKIDLVE